MTPPRMRVGGRKSSEVAMKLLAGVQQLHAEVWVATCEDSASHIEIIDVLAKVGGERSVETPPYSVIVL